MTSTATPDAPTDAAVPAVNHAPQRILRSDDILPVLDMGPYLAGRSGAKEALAAELARACDATGFFFVKNHGISQTMIDGGFSNSRRFFGLPVEERMTTAMNDSQCGYQPVKVSVHRSTLSKNNTESSTSEAFKFSFDLQPPDPDADGHRRFRGRNQWPEGLPRFREEMQRYIHAFDEMARTLLHPLALSLGQPEDFFDSGFDHPSSSVRLAHYPEMPNEGPGSYGAVPHKDLSFLTFIPPSEVQGLDVLLPGGEWLEVPRVEGALLVNTGLTLERWTNSHYSATPHRVRTSVSKERFSNIFFYYPDIDAMVEPMTKFESDPREESWSAITFGEIYRQFCDRNFAYVDTLSAKSAS